MNDPKITFIALERYLSVHAVVKIVCRMFQSGQDERERDLGEVGCVRAGFGHRRSGGVLNHVFHQR